jgi:hypothetical protein
MIPGAWRRIFDQHELFQEIETNDPTVDLDRIDKAIEQNARNPSFRC